MTKTYCDLCGEIIENGGVRNLSWYTTVAKPDSDNDRKTHANNYDCHATCGHLFLARLSESIMKIKREVNERQKVDQLDK